VLRFNVQIPSGNPLPALDVFSAPNEQGAINLHLFAQVPDLETAQEIARDEKAKKEENPEFEFHFQRAYRNLAAAFRLDIVPLKTATAKPENGGIRGLAPQDTIGQDERPRQGGTEPGGHGGHPASGRPIITGGQATSPVNCLGLVADNYS
jgi:hypothetical protein